MKANTISYVTGYGIVMSSRKENKAWGLLCSWRELGEASEET